MAKGIFDARGETAYDDNIVERYHFPGRYLAIARQVVGDWIIYREPRRGGGRSGYVAVARVMRLDPDSGTPGSSYARLGDYLPFCEVVPMEEGGRYREAILRDLDTRANAGFRLQGRSVRTVSEEDFRGIVAAGLRDTLASENAARLGLDPGGAEDVLALVDAAPDGRGRKIEQLLVSRRIRDANFRNQVLDAYDSTCAVTGLRLVNGGGRAEVQAAHIVPVAEDGPDVVQSGIALSATVHWLFDRHLISLTDDHRLLVAHNRVPEPLQRLFRRQGEAIYLPADRRSWPHPSYIGRHREKFAA